MLRKREIKQGFKELSKCAHLGGSLDEFLEREGLLEYVENQAREAVEEWKIKEGIR